MNKENIRLILEYDGTNYHGWQKQDNALTIQTIVEKAIKDLTQENVNLIAAGRTDTGVHARGQVVNFYLQKKMPLYKIYKGLNAYLPGDIVVKKVEKVEKNFHSRYDAKKRIYQYFISLDRTALYRNYCWQLFYKLNLNTLKQTAEHVFGVHDFSSFCKYEVSSDHKKCQVYESKWIEQGDFLVYRIVANRFLHGMVRTIVGTMIDVARGRFDMEDFIKILAVKDRNDAGVTAPACGLFLEEVIY
jgi:tRNA pseudouridine38-40 synthase